MAGRRPSANLPAVPTQRLNEQLPLNQNQLVNDIREAVGTWRASRYAGATANTRRLLAHWTNPLAMRRLFFAQVEALETPDLAHRSRSRSRWSHEECLLGPCRESQPGLQRQLAPGGRQDGYRHRQDGYDGDGDRLACSQRPEQPARRATRGALPHAVLSHHTRPDGARAAGCARPLRSEQRLRGTRSRTG